MAVKKAPPSSGPAAKSKFSSVNLNALHKPVAAIGGTVAKPGPKGLVALGLPSKDKKNAGSKLEPPKPVQLKSLKAENQGLDPKINLVPTGGLGWGKKADVKAPDDSEPKAEAKAERKPEPQTSPKVAPQKSLPTAPKAEPKVQNEKPTLSDRQPEASPLAPSWTGWGKVSGSKAKLQTKEFPTLNTGESEATSSSKPMETKEESHKEHPRETQASRPDAHDIAQGLRRGLSWADQDYGEEDECDEQSTQGYAHSAAAATKHVTQHRRNAEKENPVAAAPARATAGSSDKASISKNEVVSGARSDQTADEVPVDQQAAYMKEKARRAADRRREEDELLAQQRARAQEKLRQLEERAALKKKKEEALTEASAEVGQKVAKPDLEPDAANDRISKEEDGQERQGRQEHQERQERQEHPQHPERQERQECHDVKDVHEVASVPESKNNIESGETISGQKASRESDQHSAVPESKNEKMSGEKISSRKGSRESDPVRSAVPESENEKLSCETTSSRKASTESDQVRSAVPESKKEKLSGETISGQKACRESDPVRSTAIEVKTEKIEVDDGLQQSLPPKTQVRAKEIEETSLQHCEPTQHQEQGPLFDKMTDNVDPVLKESLPAESDESDSAMQQPARANKPSRSDWDNNWRRRDNRYWKNRDEPAASSGAVGSHSAWPQEENSLASETEVGKPADTATDGEPISDKQDKHHGEEVSDSNQPEPVAARPRRGWLRAEEVDEIYSKRQSEAAAKEAEEAAKAAAKSQRGKPSANADSTVADEGSGEKGGRKGKGKSREKGRNKTVRTSPENDEAGDEIAERGKSKIRRAKGKTAIGEETVGNGDWGTTGTMKSRGKNKGRGKQGSEVQDEEVPQDAGKSSGKGRKGKQTRWVVKNSTKNDKSWAAVEKEDQHEIVTDTHKVPEHSWASKASVKSNTHEELHAPKVKSRTAWDWQPGQREGSVATARLEHPPVAAAPEAPRKAAESIRSSSVTAPAVSSRWSTAGWGPRQKATQEAIANNVRMTSSHNGGGGSSSSSNSKPGLARTAAIAPTTTAAAAATTTTTTTTAVAPALRGAPPPTSCAPVKEKRARSVGPPPLPKEPPRVDRNLANSLHPVDNLKLSLGFGVVCVQSEEVHSEDGDDFGTFQTVKSKKQQKAERLEKKRLQEEEAKREAKRKTSDPEAQSCEHPVEDNGEMLQERSAVVAETDSRDIGCIVAASTLPEPRPVADSHEVSSGGGVPRTELQERPNESAGGASGSGSPALGPLSLGGGFPSFGAFGALGSLNSQPSKEIAAIWERPTAPTPGPAWQPSAPRCVPPVPSGAAFVPASAEGAPPRPLQRPLRPIGNPPPYAPPQPTRPLIVRHLPAVNRVSTDHEKPRSIPASSSSHAPVLPKQCPQLQPPAVGKPPITRAGWGHNVKTTTSVESTAASTNTDVKAEARSSARGWQQLPRRSFYGEEASSGEQGRSGNRNAVGARRSFYSPHEEVNGGRHARFGQGFIGSSSSGRGQSGAVSFPDSTIDSHIGGGNNGMSRPRGHGRGRGRGRQSDPEHPQSKRPKLMYKPKAEHKTV